MEELKRGLARVNLAQAALLTIPWSVLQFGGFWALADARAGVAGVVVIGVLVIAVFLFLAVYYHRSQIQLANLILRQSGEPGREFYGFFSLLRLWNDQLEFAHRRIPGYLNMLRLNYISLPLALLAGLLDFWITALFLVLVWGLAGMLVRSAAVRSVTGESSAVSRHVKLGIVLLFVAATIGWGYVRYEAGAAEDLCRETVAELHESSFLLTAPELAALYRLEGENGAGAVRALTQFPVMPELLKRLAVPVWVENVSPDSYVELEAFLFEHAAFMDAIAGIGRYSEARLGFDFERGFAGMDEGKLLERYLRLEEFERLSFYSSAAIGNSRRLEESWNVTGNLRRQLSGEPLLSCSLFAMDMELRRLGALERLLNEFGIHSKKEADFFAADLAVTEKEFQTSLQFALKGEASLHLISGFDPLATWSWNETSWRNFARVFPVLDWCRSGSLAVYLEGMRRFDAVVSDPGRYADVRSWAGTLPVGTAPGTAALRPAEEAVSRYFLLVRKLRAGRIALALDRYREARGGFPGTLEDWKELPAVCTDPETGEALSYRKDGFTVEVKNPVSGASRKRKFEGVEIGGEEGFRVKR